MSLASRRALLGAVFAAPLLASPAAAQDKVAVGVLRFVSSGGFYLAVERGYFKAEGIDVEIKYFEAAQPIAVAIASGDIQFGVTALTAGTYNLAAKGALKVIAAQAGEKKGYEGNALIASNEAHAKGFTSFAAVAGRSIGITQIGSSFHYQLGQIATAQGFELKQVQMKPLQQLPAMIAAVKTNQVDGIIIAPHLAKPMVARGEAKLIGWLSDVGDYNYGALFANSKLVAERRALAERFVKAYRRGAADYAAAFMKRDASGARMMDATADEAAALIGKHVYPADPAAEAVAKVKASASAIDPDARLDLADIERQIAWYKKEGLADAGVDAKTFVDTSFVK